MLKIFYCFLLISIINCDILNKIHENSETFDDCVKNPIQCQGLKIATNLVNTAIKNTGDIEIGDGIHIVTSHDNHTPPVVEGAARSVHGGVVSEDGLFNTIQNYLVSHEIRIKLQNFLPSGDSIRSTLRSFNDMAPLKDGIGESGRGKKDKGGGAMILVMAMMMGKMMMTMGFGGIGLMAMKALMVSALALMLSTVIGLKKLASSGHEESGHQVIYAGHHDGHHRKRRSTSFDNQILLPYRGWIEYIKQLQ